MGPPFRRWIVQLRCPRCDSLEVMPGIFQTELNATVALRPGASRQTDGLMSLPSIWLGHGASGGPETMQPYLDELGRRGLVAHPLRLPRGSAERAMGPLRDQVGEELPRALIGGHSFGGRVASLVAAETPPAGLVLLSYPLHRPGHPMSCASSTGPPSAARCCCSRATATSSPAWSCCARRSKRCRGPSCTSTPACVTVSRPSPSTSASASPSSTPRCLSPNRAPARDADAATRVRPERRRRARRRAATAPPPPPPARQARP